MGQLVRPTATGLTLEAMEEPGCELLYTADGARLVADCCQLALDEASPLSPRAKQYVRPGRGKERVRLEPGVWWVRRASATPEEYLHVELLSVRLVSRAEAYCLLGALEVLQELGLEDAAVSLKAGEFDLASVQVLEELARRRQTSR